MHWLFSAFDQLGAVGRQDQEILYRLLPQNSEAGLCEGERTNISATNPLILKLAKKAMQKN